MTMVIQAFVLISPNFYSLNGRRQMSNVKCQFLFFFSFLFCVKIVFMNPYFSLAGILTIINPHRFSSSTLKKYKFLSGFTIWDLSFWKKKSFFEWFYFLGFSIFLSFLKKIGFLSGFVIWVFEYFVYDWFSFLRELGVVVAVAVGLLSLE